MQLIQFKTELTDLTDQTGQTDQTELTLLIHPQALSPPKHFHLHGNGMKIVTKILVRKVKFQALFTENKV